MNNSERIIVVVSVAIFLILLLTGVDVLFPVRGDRLTGTVVGASYNLGTSSVGTSFIVDSSGEIHTVITNSSSRESFTMFVSMKGKIFKVLGDVTDAWFVKPGDVIDFYERRGRLTGSLLGYAK